jgi:putative hydrolase of the HAD superfamily
MTINALILDADGVLIPPLRFTQYLKREYPAIAEQTHELFSGAFADCIVGRADLREVLPPLLEKWGWPHTLDDYLNLWFEEENVVDERLVKAVRAMRESGMPCYVATNQERHRASFMRSYMRFGELFDGLFASAELGCKKPDAKFYDTITNQLGISPETILFWDDTKGHVDAAKACGWQAKLYTDFDSFLNEMNRILDI